MCINAFLRVFPEKLGARVNIVPHFFFIFWKLGARASKNPLSIFLSRPHVLIGPKKYGTFFFQLPRYTDYKLGLYKAVFTLQQESACIAILIRPCCLPLLLIVQSVCSLAARKDAITWKFFFVIFNDAITYVTPLVSFISLSVGALLVSAVCSSIFDNWALPMQASQNLLI